MVTRTFLGWDQPLLELATDWLLEQRDELPHWLVITPTSQAARRLRREMTSRVGAILSPTFMTPGALMKTPNPAVADDWVEQLAWQETLENINDWSPYKDLFPQAPETQGEWAGGLASELLSLRRALQENGLTLFNASRMLKSSVEADRWNALAELERAMEKQLGSWNYDSRSRILANGIQFPTDITKIILVGISEMPPLVERCLKEWDGPVTTLISAPQSEAESFTDIGIPLESWCDRNLPWPSNGQDGVHITADTRQQASEALHLVSSAKTNTDDLAIGSADTEAGDALASVFTKAGWTAFHPASPTITTGLKRWLTTWSNWLIDPKLSTMMDLLGLPETETLIQNNRAQTAIDLSALRNQWMINRPDDLRHRINQDGFRSDQQRAAANNVVKAVDSLEQWRAMFQRKDFTEPLQRIITTLSQHSSEAAEQSKEIYDWLENAQPLIKKSKRSAKFWIDLMLSSLPAPTNQPPDGRVIDVQGWLELLFEPGKHLVLCGMNEGKVPASNSGDPWLGESANEFLGLLTNAQRAARDAFLYQAMLEARKSSGKVDLICSKTSSSGDPMLPSRLLLANDDDTLPSRIKHLFKDIPPPESKLRWEKEWTWKTPTQETSKRLSATAFKSYLACPFRFYLKHALNMQTHEPDRVEWSPRDFGNVAHDILERWGRDETERAKTDAHAIHAWLSDELDRVAHHWFGKRIPLAVRMQIESMRRRFIWFSQVQATLRADGWEVAEVEHKFEIPAGDSLIVAKIDRIDRHTESGELRVIDYKTGKVKKADTEHRTKITAATTLPDHLSEDGPAIYSEQDQKGKTVEYRWTDLQLPLYALAIKQRDGTIPTPCYFTLGSTENEVKFHPWTKFSENDLDAAEECANWITAEIEQGHFWPPAEKVKYDDFESLTASRPISEMFQAMGADH